MATERFWVINHNADLTETGCTQQRTYLKTDWEGFESQRTLELEIVSDWCYVRFGPKVAYVQGVAPTLSWIVSESNENEFVSAKSVMYGIYKIPTKKVVLGIGLGNTVNKYYDELL